MTDQIPEEVANQPIPRIVTAKFEVTERDARKTWYNEEYGEGGRVKMQALYHDKNGNYAEYNKEWAAATPSGELEMQVDNHAAFATLKVGAVVMIRMEIHDEDPEAPAEPETSG